MLRGVSIGTLDSHQSAISPAWRLVSEAANLQPAFPVHATSPARMCDALTERPIVSMAAVATPTFSSRTPDISRFCQTVSRMSPSPRSFAIFASPRIWTQLILPSGSATPRSEEHTSELQSHSHLVCRIILEKKKKEKKGDHHATRPGDQEGRSG